MRFLYANSLASKKAEPEVGRRDGGKKDEPAVVQRQSTPTAALSSTPAESVEKVSFNNLKVFCTLYEHKKKYIDLL